jgi:hypothetical protein
MRTNNNTKASVWGTKLFIQIENFVPRNTNFVKAEFTVLVEPIGIQFHNCTLVCLHDGKLFIDFPVREATKNQTGKYFHLVELQSEADKEAFDREVLRAIDKYRTTPKPPDFFDELLGSNSTTQPSDTLRGEREWDDLVLNWQDKPLPGRTE